MWKSKDGEENYYNSVENDKVCNKSGGGEWQEKRYVHVPYRPI